MQNQLFSFYFNGNLISKINVHREQMKNLKYQLESEDYERLCSINIDKANIKMSHPDSEMYIRP